MMITNLLIYFRTGLINIILSSVGKALLEALEQHPEEFESTAHTLVHKPSNTTWWISNGGFFFNGYNGTPKVLNLLERHYLYYKAKQAQKRLLPLLSLTVSLELAFFICRI